jgi:MFS family permease
MNAAPALLVIRRRTRIFWTCHLLRWLPLGLVMPVLALLPAQKGLDTAAIGLIFGVYTATAAVLELPTGTLTDVVGSRPVLVIASVLETTCFTGLLFADSAGEFCGTLALGGVGRALNSGALEAWYVEGVYAEQPGANVRPAIGAAMFLTNAAVLIGSLTVAALPKLPDTLTDKVSEPSLLPILAALPCGALQVFAVLVLVHEPQRHRDTRPVLRALACCPAVAWDSIRVSLRQRNLRWLLVAGVGVGVGIGAVETFWQPEFARMIENPAAATSMVGLLVTASTVAGSLGSLLAARVSERLLRRKDLLCASLLVLIGSAIAGMAIAPSPLVAAACFVGVYLFLELRAPLAQTLLHASCPPGRRASVLSAYSMSTSAGAVVASLGLGTILGALGTSTIWLAAAAVVTLASIAYLRLQPERPPTADTTPAATSALR